MSSMSADHIGADFGQLEQTNALISSQAAHFNNLLAEGKNIANTIAQQWSGEAHLAYEAEQKKWDTAAANLNETLVRINRALAQTAQDLHATDRSNAGLFGA